LSATATWALCALTVSRAAEALGRPADAARYRELHASIAAAFQRRFLDQGTRNPVDLLLSERVTVVLVHAVDGARRRPALEQTKQPGSQHGAMVDELIENAL
jgi:hypothetical protein